MADSTKPHVDAVCGQAAWALVQGIALRLVKDGVIPKATMKDDVTQMVKYHRRTKDLNPAQRGAGEVLAQFYHYLETADRSDAH
jgi:hypothetical protein